MLAPSDPADLESLRLCSLLRDRGFEAVLLDLCNHQCLVIFSVIDFGGSPDSLACVWSGWRDMPKAWAIIKSLVPNANADRCLVGIAD